MLVILWHQYHLVQLHGTGAKICCDQYNNFPNLGAIALCTLHKVMVRVCTFWVVTQNYVTDVNSIVGLKP